MSGNILENFAGVQLLDKRSDEDLARYNCQLCGNLMKKPLQTYRGNAACFKCYQEAFTG